MADPLVQKVALKALVSLPTPVLRALSGGGVVYRGGRTLDPVMQFLTYTAANKPPLWTLTLEDARAAVAAALAAMAAKPPADVRTESVAVPTAEGHVGGRVYRPPFQDLGAPLMVYLHQGAGVWGGLDTAGPFCARLARGAGCPVLALDYRLAPEHRFPAGLEDALAAFRWARENAARFGAPAGHAAVGGESMGANFAAVICQTLKQAGEPQPALQLLIYPMVDFASETRSMSLYADAYPLSRRLIDWLIGFYLKADDSPEDLRLSPLRAPDLSGLAPAVVATAGFDPLLDQGEAYARRLIDARVPTVYRCYDNLAHGFLGFTGVAPAARLAADEVVELAREGFGSNPAPRPPPQS
jgi:acetyl esterase/lipase